MNNVDDMTKNKETGRCYLIESAYILPSTIGVIIESLITEATGHYNGNLKHKEIWVKHIRRLLAHIFSSSLNRNKDEVKWIPFPIANKEFLKKIPQALSTKLGHTRGFDVLVALNIIELKPHSFKSHECTRLKIAERVYSLVKEPLLNSEFEIRSYQINGEFCLFEEIKRRGEKKVLKRPTHDLSNFYTQNGCVRQSKELIKYYRESLDKLAPVRINIDILIGYIKDVRRKITDDRGVENQKSLESNVARMLQAEATLLNILDDYKVVNENPFIVEYYPKYKAAAIGGRLFEVNSGVQNLPRELKQKCLVGYNHDLVSSQLNILKFYATKYLGYSDIGFESVDDIASHLEIDRELAKKVLYGTLFNAGTVSTSHKNTVFQELSSLCGKEKSKEIITEWKRLGSQLISIIKELQKVFKTSGDFVITKKNGEKYLKNDVGILLKYSYIDEKQKMSHIIQGLESSYLLKVINLNLGQIAALEHDGFVTQLEGVVAPEIDNLGLTVKSSYFPTQEEKHDHSGFTPSNSNRIRRYFTHNAKIRLSNPSNTRSRSKLVRGARG